MALFLGGSTCEGGIYPFVLLALWEKNVSKADRLNETVRPEFPSVSTPGLVRFVTDLAITWFAIQHHISQEAQCNHPKTSQGLLPVFTVYHIWNPSVCCLDYFLPAWLLHESTNPANEWHQYMHPTRHDNEVLSPHTVWLLDLDCYLDCCRLAIRCI